MERMSSVAERLRSLQMDDEEAQRLQLMRKTEVPGLQQSGLQAQLSVRRI